MDSITGYYLGIFGDYHYFKADDYYGLKRIPVGLTTIDSPLAAMLKEFRPGLFVKLTPRGFKALGDPVCWWFVPDFRVEYDPAKKMPREKKLKKPKTTSFNNDLKEVLFTPHGRAITTKVELLRAPCAYTEKGRRVKCHCTKCPKQLR